MCGASASAESEPDGRRVWHRIALLACGGIALVVGLCTGLVRLGFGAVPLAAFAEFHGPLLICGMFGTLTTLERAVASHRPRDYAAPAFCAAGTFFILCGAPAAGAGLYVLASAAVSIFSLRTAMRHPALFTIALAASALFWLIGNIVWLAGGSVPAAIGWWLGFLVFVIGGERLEFGGPRPPGPAFAALFLMSLLLMAAGSSFTLVEPLGTGVTGAAFVLGALWMAANDRTLWRSRSRGQTRFLAASLLAGYAWLATGGFVLLAGVRTSNAFTYDMTIHAVAVGFALSMVFGHALLVLPSIARSNLAFSPVLYIPLVVLQAGVALRIAGGLTEWMQGRMLSGPVIAGAIATFAAVLAGIGIAARISRASIKQPARV